MCARTSASCVAEARRGGRRPSQDKVSERSRAQMFEHADRSVGVERSCAACSAKSGVAKRISWATPSRSSIRCPSMQSPEPQGQTRSFRIDIRRHGAQSWARLVLDRWCFAYLFECFLVIGMFTTALVCIDEIIAKLYHEHNNVVECSMDGDRYFAAPSWCSTSTQRGSLALYPTIRSSFHDNARTHDLSRSLMFGIIDQTRTLAVESSKCHEAPNPCVITLSVQDLNSCDTTINGAKPQPRALSRNTVRQDCPRLSSISRRHCSISAPSAPGNSIAAECDRECFAVSPPRIFCHLR